MESSPKPKKSTVERKDGRVLRRMTIYLDVELARKLRIHCAKEGMKISEGIANAIRQVLDK